MKIQVMDPSILAHVTRPLIVLALSAVALAPTASADELRTGGIGVRSIRDLLGASDEELAALDPLVMNLIVAKSIPGLEGLNVNEYVSVVDSWANDIRARLPQEELVFHQAPGKWKRDVRFFRLGQVAGYLDSVVGIRYIDEQKRAKEVRYTNPSDLFVNGIIDRKLGTCANMPVLHVAVGWRLGWPVSLACVNSHYVCRFDDGTVAYNIEATDTGRGGFAAGTDQEYRDRFGIPLRAKKVGSDLTPLTPRQLLGVFIGLRARHFDDIDNLEAAERDYLLARYLFPENRKLYLQATKLYVFRGAQLFEPTEHGHPISLARWLNASFGIRPLSPNTVPSKNKGAKK